MADGVIAFPLRYAPSGALITVPDGSDAEVEQIIAIGVLTRIGERPLNPLFGVPDPVFAGLDVADVQTTLNTFGPAGVDVRELSHAQENESTALIRIGWTRQD